MQDSRGQNIDRELRTLAKFIQVYCDDHHAEAERKAVSMKTMDLSTLKGGAPCLCEECGRLLAHAFVKRSHCPMDPKPMCKKCPKHCYAPAYRQQIRQVMAYSGKKLVLHGRVDYLLHLFF
jgi:hypothetical protein